MMWNWKKNLIAPAILALALVLTMGCGGNDDGAANVEKAADAATEVALHDCAGDCGMKAMTADQTTMVDGKPYCSGCAKKAEGAEHPSGGTDHPK